MRHQKRGRKLGTDASHTKAMKKSLVTALFLNDRIKTTATRAKEIRPEVDRVITWAKAGTLHARRQAITALGGDSTLVGEIFQKAEQGMWADRNGGYTRIFKLGPRKGDNAPMVIMELVQEAVQPKEKKEAPAKKAAPAAKKAEAKPEEEPVEETPEVEEEQVAEEDASEDVVAEETVEAEEAAEADDAEEVKE